MTIEAFQQACLLKLEKLPAAWEHSDKHIKVCPLAVMRLKHIKAAVAAKGKELTEEEESQLPGCPYAIRNQTCGYCFFVYEATLLNESIPTDTEIAYMLDISVDNVRKTFDTALNKVKTSQFVNSVKSSMEGEPIVDTDFSIEDEFIYCE